MGISAVVLTLNEETNIDRCLRSLDFADEIVVLDSFSSDRTVEIARRYTDKVHTREFTGFSDQKNAALALARQEWVLVVDADEVVTPELAAEVLEAVKSGEHDAYRFPRLSYFLGKPMRHCGWYPDYVTRLARRSKVHFPDRLVHETLHVDGTVGALRNDLIHFSYGSMEDYTRKMFLYARAAARQKQVEGERFRASDITLAPTFNFLKKYVLQQGYRDGIRGLILSALAACSTVLRHAMLWEMTLHKKEIEEQAVEK